MVYNPEMLVLARESRGLTQAELAKTIGIAQSTLSKYENGQAEIPSEVVCSVARELRYRESLFSRDQSPIGISNTCLYHRKRQSLSVVYLREIEAKFRLKRMQIQRLLTSVDIEPEVEFPVLDIGDYKSPTQVADYVRRIWRLPLGPIKNLVGAIERAGAVIVPFRFGTTRIDAISQWPKDTPPLFFVNTEMPWDRIRFSLAHELGHLIMHRYPTEHQEAEADEFASAFLMPERDISSDLENITWIKAADLKPYWRVSMQALVRRAYSLEKITNSQYRRMFTELSRFGHRRNEPVEIAAEQIYVYYNLVNLHLTEFDYTLPSMSELVDIYEEEFSSDFLPRPNRPVRIK